MDSFFEGSVHPHPKNKRGKKSPKDHNGKLEFCLQSCSHTFSTQSAEWLLKRIWRKGARQGPREADFWEGKSIMLVTNQSPT
jgi:hypothetical protein